MIAASAQVIDFASYRLRASPARPTKPKKLEFTEAQRRQMIWCLGYSPSTIDTYSRTLSELELQKRIAKREAVLLPEERLRGRKNVGESDFHASIRIRKEPKKTRKRSFGVTAARRIFSKTFGCCIRTATRRTKGLDASQVMALVDAKAVTSAR